MSAPELPISFTTSDPLAEFARDLTEAASRGELEPVRCRERETERLVATLLRQGKNNPVLIGEAGVGKTAVAEGFAERIARGDVPQQLRDVRLYAVSHLDLIAGTSFRGQYEKRLKALIDRASSDRNVILFIDELHNLIGAGSAMGQPMDAANMLKPALSRGALRVIGATTRAEFERWIRPDAALERRFQPIEVNELGEDQTVEVLAARRPRLEGHHLLALTDEILRDAVRVSNERAPNRRQPDKAIDLVDEACSLRRVRAGAELPAEVAELAAERDRLLADERKLIDDLFGGDRASLLAKFSYGTFFALENMGLVLERLITGSTTPRPRVANPETEKQTREIAERLADTHKNRLLLDDRLRESLDRNGLVLTHEDLELAAG
jgi:ATP-dependent Clp protease ATP-binding subunit ClpC